MSLAPGGLEHATTDRGLAGLLAGTRAGSEVTAVWFTAAWCGPCAVLGPHVASVATRYLGRGVRFVAVDIDQCPGAAAAFAISAVPTVVVLRGGVPAQRLVGLVGERELMRALDGALAS